MKTKQADWRFVGWWVLAAIAINIINAIVHHYLSFWYPTQASLLRIITISFLQWLVIRPYFKREGYWLFVTVLGFITTYLVIHFSTNFPLNIETIYHQNPVNDTMVIDNSFLTFTLIILSISGLIGTFYQWLVLRKETSRSIWWLIIAPSINILLYTIIILSRLLLGVLVSGNPFDHVLDLFVHLLVMGDIINSFPYVFIQAVGIGILLMWILQKPILPEDEIETEVV